VHCIFPSIKKEIFFTTSSSFNCNRGEGGSRVTVLNIVFIGIYLKNEDHETGVPYIQTKTIYRVFQNDCWGLNYLSYTIHLRWSICIFLFNRPTLQVFVTYLFPQVSRNSRYESEPPLKPSPLTCYKEFGTNSIIVLMFVQSQRVHI